MVDGIDNYRIQKFSSDGTLLEWCSLGSDDDQLNNRYRIAVDHRDNVYVADSKNHRIQKFSFDKQESAEEK